VLEHLGLAEQGLAAVTAPSTSPASARCSAVVSSDSVAGAEHAAVSASIAR
jgi:hypothetical protein